MIDLNALSLKHKTFKSFLSKNSKKKTKKTSKITSSKNHNKRKRK